MSGFGVGGVCMTYFERSSKLFFTGQIWLGLVIAGGVEGVSDYKKVALHQPKWRLQVKKKNEIYTHIVRLYSFILVRKFVSQGFPLVKMLGLFWGKK